MNHLALQLDNSHGSMFMSIQFHKGKTAVGLHADFG
jgi:hypothetical protein